MAAGRIRDVVRLAAHDLVWCPPLQRCLTCGSQTHSGWGSAVVVCKAEGDPVTYELVVPAFWKTICTGN